MPRPARRAVPRRWLLGGIAAVVVIGVGALWTQTANHDPTRPDPNDSALVGQGKVVYTQHCASCHGANLEGQRDWRHRMPDARWPAPPHDATGHTWHHPDKVLFQVTKYGGQSLVPDRETDMPAFDGVLSDADIWAVISYIESTWPPDIRARQQRLNRPDR